MKSFTVQTKKKKSNSLWILKFALLALVFLIIYLVNFILKYYSDIKIDGDVYIKKWTWLISLYNNLTDTEIKYFKLYLKFHWETLDDIKPWYYAFSGTYSKQWIIDVLKKWPTQKYAHITILEWWSKFDIDESLANKGYIEPWDYIKFIDDKDIISKYAKRYEFISGMWDIKSLEWVLYPDTYYIDPTKNILDQLVYVQLDTFDKKVWKDYKDALNSFNSRLSSYWYDFRMSLYEVITLASIIDKEERNFDQKFSIASIFLNRKQAWMRLDADISLCYWLKKSYKKCTPSVISANIKDATNPYNTRTNKLFPPTPICNFWKDSLSALLNFKQTQDLYYLHDSSWVLHTAKTNDEHNINKSRYLK